MDMGMVILPAQAYGRVRLGYGGEAFHGVIWW